MPGQLPKPMFFLVFIVNNFMYLTKPHKIEGLKQIFEKYDVYFIDLWGVMHNGVECYAEAITVLKELKNHKKKVILISNAPRPSRTVNLFLEKIGLPHTLYDLLITSGDITQQYLIENKEKKKFYHLGPDRDKDLFENEKIHISNKEECDEIICTGLIFSEKEDIQEYEAILQYFKNKQTPMICANPDEVVIRGTKLEYCAGALAKKYQEMGGKVTYYGKPYLDIYSTALKKMNILQLYEQKKIIPFAIGDNLKTDIKGANSFNISSLLILNGIYKDFIRNDEINFEELKSSVNLQQLQIHYYQKDLIW